MKKAPAERYLVLFVPWALALLFRSDPAASYFIAWLGSFLIFYLTLSGWVKPLPKDRSVAEQLMRPIYLVQIIFAGYTCCTSIFYFLSVLGYQDFNAPSNLFLIDYQKLAYTAQCQRYYALGHAAFVTGILATMRYPIKPKYYVENSQIANLLFKAALITLPVSVLFLKVPGLSQFYNQFNSLSFIAGTLALAFAIPERKIGNTLVCIILYISNFYQALISGFKEPIIVSVLVLGLFLYPTYKKLVMMTFGPALLVIFLLLPTYNRIYRQNAWNEELSAEEASQAALDAAFKGGSSDDDSNWGFLTLRLSEIDMFTNFVKSTPDKIDYYGTTLLKQSAIAVVPRIFWPGKPITEDLIMERVYDADVINRGSNVSAKPAIIVDAYLSDGAIGILITLFLYGSLAQYISQHAEKMFGGYILGTALVFSGLFQIFWRGISFEFFINTVFWAYISMLVIHKIFVGTHILKRV